MNPQRSEKQKDTGRSEKGLERGKSRRPDTQHGVDRRPQGHGKQQERSTDEFEHDEQGDE
jgi:hypothetical protein